MKNTKYANYPNRLKDLEPYWCLSLDHSQIVNFLSRSLELLWAIQICFRYSESLRRQAFRLYNQLSAISSQPTKAHTDCRNHSASYCSTVTPGEYNSGSSGGAGNFRPSISAPTALFTNCSYMSVFAFDIVSPCVSTAELLLCVRTSATNSFLKFPPSAA